jgi:hypothetical protein
MVRAVPEPISRVALPGTTAGSCRRSPAGTSMRGIPARWSQQGPADREIGALRPRRSSEPFEADIDAEILGRAGARRRADNVDPLAPWPRHPCRRELLSFESEYARE